jgi:hypothetical protein
MTTTSTELPAIIAVVFPKGVLRAKSRPAMKYGDRPLPREKPHHAHEN